MPEVAAKTFALLAATGAKNLTWYHLFDSRAERVETGNSINVGSTSTHTLYPMYTFQRTLVFLTWEE